MSNYFQAMARGKDQGCPLHFAPGAMLDHMLDSRSAPLGMSTEEFQQTSINLAVAGYLSTIFLIATGTWSLLQQPDQLALVKAQPELWPAAVNEMVRLDSPVQVTDRVAAQDTEIAGQAIRKGDRIGIVVGSANRDETVFTDPERLDIQRDTSATLGFGIGIHRCLGEPLALAQAPVAFKALFDAFPQLQLDGDPQWMTNPYLRSVANLPLRLG
jgi:cytochrome P450